jgi:hypothetical protein
MSALVSDRLPLARVLVAPLILAAPLLFTVNDAWQVTTWTTGFQVEASRFVSTNAKHSRMIFRMEAVLRQ